jgi:hypothetical protein
MEDLLRLGVWPEAEQKEFKIALILAEKGIRPRDEWEEQPYAAVDKIGTVQSFTFFQLHLNM